MRRCVCLDKSTPHTCWDALDISEVGQELFAYRPFELESLRCENNTNLCTLVPYIEHIHRRYFVPTGKAGALVCQLSSCSWWMHFLGSGIILHGRVSLALMMYFIHVDVIVHTTCTSISNYISFAVPNALRYHVDLYPSSITCTWSKKRIHDIYHYIYCDIYHYIYRDIYHHIYRDLIHNCLYVLQQTTHWAWSVVGTGGWSTSAFSAAIKLNLASVT